MQTCYSFATLCMTFFAFYVTELLVVEEIEDNCWRAQTDAYDELQLISPKDCPSFWDQVGMNTGYINHPEEIWAENFMELMTNQNLNELPNPELIEYLDSVLST